jgi:SAM-dependent methyltransferase
VAALELGNVELVAGDIHELGAAVGGPFDVAYTRLFLMHQPDPVRTLRQIARLLRPGGWVVAQEALRSPPGAVDGLAGSAREAGLDVVAVEGSFGITNPELGFGLHASTLLAAKERAVASGVATGPQIDDLVSDLHAAKDDGYEWVSTPFFLDLTLRKPSAA